MPEVILLTLTLFLCGAYFGLTLFCQIGLLPAMRPVAPQTFQQTWRAIDTYMDRLMPPYKLTLLAVNLALAIVAYRSGQTHLATYAGISFALWLIALVLTITMQLPVNKAIATATNDADLRTLLTKTNTNFALRFALAVVSFLALCIAATRSPSHL